MAVIQTPQGRVIGLILPQEEQPKPEPIAETVKAEPAKKPGRPPKK